MPTPSTPYPSAKQTPRNLEPSVAASRRLRPGLAGVIVLAAALTASAAPPPASSLRNPEITAAEVTSHVRYLSSDELQGRGSGTKGNDRAAEYIAARFKAIGLTPGGERRSFFQRFPVFTGVELGKENRIELKSGGSTDRLRVNEDFLPLGFSRNGAVTAPVVFAGYGISQPELSYDDYAGLDVRGKVVLVLRHTPDGDDNGKFGPYAPLTYKLLTAREKGAAGILLATGPLNEEPQPPAEPGRGLDGPQTPARRPRFPGLQRASASADSGILAAFVDLPVAERLLQRAGKQVKELQIAIAHGTPQSFPIPDTEATLRVEIRRETKVTRNVLGVLEGSDPQLKDEAVVIGAHYDHLGLGGDHSLAESAAPAIHHGADDNASGTAGILELAQYFAAHRSEVGRSLVFMAFSGEEMGLLGSAHWVKNPTLPLEKIAAMINLDMVGRMKADTVQVLGAGSSPAWKGLLEEANQPHRLQLKSGGGGSFGGSDHQSFYAKQIPVLFFFTGIHPDYHRPSDTWEKVNAEGEARLLQFVRDTTRRISHLTPRPPFSRTQEEQQAPSPGFRVFLGTIPDYAEEVVGVLLQGVREGSPAEKAGVKAGDVLVELGGKSIRNVQEYTTILSGLKANVEVAMVVVRKGERLSLKITPRAR